MEEHNRLREHIKTRMEEQLSVLSPWGYGLSSCGYCKSGPLKTSPNYYAGSKKQDVHPLHYQVMADRGWRRSGTTYYKPNVKHACCPHYTIRCNAKVFTPNRSHRKVINRWNAYIQGSDYRYKAKRLCPRSKEDKKQQRNTFEFVSKLHASEDTHVLHPIDPKTSNPIQPEHKFTVTLEPDTFTEEKWALYEHYQRRVHKDITTRNSFRNFLCTGLPRSTYTPPVYEGTPDRMIGSYHAVYRLDGKVVAIGVLDLLPYGVSSVYLMYHESVSAFGIGKLAALWEIALAREKGYGWYYMGYYIHSCTKMQYKRGYGETYILDPEGIDEGKWDRLDEKMLKLMDEKKYVSMTRQERMVREGRDKDTEICVKDERSDDDEGFSANIWSADMPGVPSFEAIKAKWDILGMKIRYGDWEAELGDLQFGYGGETAADALHAKLAEFAACLGPWLFKYVVADLR